MPEWPVSDSTTPPSHLGQLHQLGLGARPHHAASGDDDGPLGLRQHVNRGSHGIRLRLGTERRHLHEALLPERSQIGFALQNLGVRARHLQMHRARCGAGRDAEGLPQQVRESLQRVDVEVRLGDLLPHGEVFDLLVDVLVARRGVDATGQGDDGRARHVRVS
jgi:hypothetical protein